MKSNDSNPFGQHDEPTKQDIKPIEDTQRTPSEHDIQPVEDIQTTPDPVGFEQYI